MSTSEPEPVETPEVEAPAPLPPPPTSAQAEAAENLLRQARLARIRGQNSVADKLLDEAVQTAPGSPTVLEAVGDSLAERRQWRKAQDVYGQAHRIAPDNASIERKFGETVLMVAGARDPMSYLSSGEPEGVAGAKAAAVMSFFIPGLGQIARGQVTRGVGMLATVIVAWVVAILTPDGLTNLPRVMVGRSNDLNGFVFLPLFVAVATHLWSIVDATAGAKRAAPRVVTRPQPPVDKDFEL